MMRNKEKKFCRGIVLFIVTVMLLNTVSVHAASINSDKGVEDEKTVELSVGKITPELQKVMDTASSDELIPVWLWLEPVAKEVIEQRMINEKI